MAVHVCASSTNSLGCKVGTCCPNLSSLSMCSSVVLPALSRPRNTNLPDFLYSPETKPEAFQSASLGTTTLFLDRLHHITEFLAFGNFTHEKMSPSVNSGDQSGLS